MIARRIKELRAEKGLSQAQLGREIGTSQKAVDFWERGVHEPKASYIVAMCDYFEVSADYLLGRRDM